MARVELEVVIHAPLETVYAVARDVEAFPQFMPDVKSVRILEKATTAAARSLSGSPTPRNSSCKSSGRKKTSGTTRRAPVASAK